MPCTVTSGTVTWSQTGIRLKGGAGSKQPLNRKPSLSLDLGHFGKDHRFLGLQRFHLNNSVQDPSCLNEILYAGIFEAADVPSPRCWHARVSLNGRDLGIYVLREAVDREFLARHLSSPHGDRFQGAHGTDPIPSKARFLQWLEEVRRSSLPWG